MTQFRCWTFVITDHMSLPKGLWCQNSLNLLACLKVPVRNVTFFSFFFTELSADSVQESTTSCHLPWQCLSDILYYKPLFTQGAFAKHVFSFNIALLYILSYTQWNHSHLQVATQQLDWCDWELCALLKAAWTGACQGGGGCSSAREGIHTKSIIVKSLN